MSVSHLASLCGEHSSVTPTEAARFLGDDPMAKKAGKKKKKASKKTKKRR
jgi:hypothetical protein